MASSFLMQIVDTRTNTVVEFEPGKTVEIDFVTDVVSRVIAKGVGVFRTQEHVAKDVRDAIEEAIYGLKLKIKP